ncbi:unnamed protein product, partial [Discosporangium mesarthrocarpum]
MYPLQANPADTLRVNRSDQTMGELHKSDMPTWHIGTKRKQESSIQSRAKSEGNLRTHMLSESTLLARVGQTGVQTGESRAGVTVTFPARVGKGLGYIGVSSPDMLDTGNLGFQGPEMLEPGRHSTAFCGATSQQQRRMSNSDSPAPHSFMSNAPGHGVGPSSAIRGRIYGQVQGEQGQGRPSLSRSASWVGNIPGAQGALKGAQEQRRPLSQGSTMSLSMAVAAVMRAGSNELPSSLPSSPFSTSSPFPSSSPDPTSQAPTCSSPSTYPTPPPRSSTTPPGPAVMAAGTPTTMTASSLITATSVQEQARV